MHNICVFDAFICVFERNYMCLMYLYAFFKENTCVDAILCVLCVHAPPCIGREISKNACFACMHRREISKTLFFSKLCVFDMFYMPVFMYFMRFLLTHP